MICTKNLTESFHDEKDLFYQLKFLLIFLWDKLLAQNCFDTKENSNQTIIDRTSPSLMKPIYSSLLILKNLFIFINLKTTLTMKSHFN